MRLSKAVTLEKLERELVAAGVIPEGQGIGTAGDQIFTYDDKGEQAPMPRGATAVIDAHEVEAPPEPRDRRLARALRAFAQANADATTLAGLRAAAAGLATDLAPVFEDDEETP